MSTLITPSKNYPTIQSAIDIAKPGDTIKILPGFYNEQLSIINKDNLTILAVNSKGEPSNGNQVRFTGTGTRDIALRVYANNITVSGLVFTQYYQAISLIGNNNILNYIVSIYCDIGVSIRGNNNKIISCLSENNTIVGINIGGDYNQIIATAIRFNELGINALEGSFVGNIFYKNLIHNNGYINLRISTPYADMTVYRENTISNSDFGILNNFGRVAIISNFILEHTKVGISCKDSNNIILDNNLAKNSTGEYLETCNSLIAGNIVQEGDISGILVTGDNNKIIQNSVTNYGNTGLVINGCKNDICNNNLEENKKSIIINGIKNCTNCDYNYCAGISCKNVTDYSQLLNIFKLPLSKFLIKDNSTSNC